MRKTQLWSIIKEISYTIDDWDQDVFEKEINKPEMIFKKFIPAKDNWKEMECFVVKIKIIKEKSYVAAERE